MASSVTQSTITLQQSQAIDSYNKDGYAVGIPLRDETGTLSTLKINPETGELYNAAGLDLTPTVGDIPIDPNAGAAFSPTVGDIPIDPNAGKVDVKPGVGANDDSGKITSDTTQKAINQIQTDRIEPQPNILDQYASYTYSLSWFLLDPTTYKSVRSSSSISQFRNKLLQNAQLLVRSGGAPRELGTGQPKTTSADLKIPNTKFNTSPEFNLDFYIDNLELESKLWGKGSTATHNVLRLRFSIFEPYGITLIPRLFKSVQNIFQQRKVVSGNTKPNYVAAQYGLLISFYGYDDDGNLVKAQNNNNISRSLSQTQIIDSSATVEKFYPFIIINIKFKVANKVTEYTIEAAPVPYSINASQARNTIPFPIQVVGSTVKEMLIGKDTVNASRTQPDGRVTSQAPASFDGYYTDYA
jgi:hypothetical protein